MFPFVSVPHQNQIACCRVNFFASITSFTLSIHFFGCLPGFFLPLHAIAMERYCHRMTSVRLSVTSVDCGHIR